MKLTSIEDFLKEDRKAVYQTDFIEASLENLIKTIETKIIKPYKGEDVAVSGKDIIKHLEKALSLIPDMQIEADML